MSWRRSGVSSKYVVVLPTQVFAFECFKMKRCPGHLIKERSDANLGLSGLRDVEGLGFVGEGLGLKIQGCQLGVRLYDHRCICYFTSTAAVGIKHIPRSFHNDSLGFI